MSVFTPIVNEIAPSGSGVDSSLDCSCVDYVLFDIHSGGIVPGLVLFRTEFLEYGIYYKHAPFQRLLKRDL